MENTTESAAAVTPVEQSIKLTVYLITIALGLVGNVLVIMDVVAKKARRIANDIFIMNLAVADLTLIFLLPIDIYIMFHSFPENEIFCSFLLPFNTVPFVVSIFTLTSMAVHRCRVILNPFGGDMSHRLAIFCIVIIWMVSFFILLPYMIVSEPGQSACHESWPTMAHKKAYTASLFLVQYLLPLVIIAVAYIRIGLDLYQVKLPCATPPPRREYSNGMLDPDRNRENAQVIKTLAIIVILFAVCMFPIQIAWMMSEFGGPEARKSSDIIFKFALGLAVFHSCLNPLVYGTLTRRVGRYYKQYISHCCACCKNQLPETSRNETDITMADHHQMDSLLK